VQSRAAAREPAVLGEARARLDSVRRAAWRVRGVIAEHGSNESLEAFAESFELRAAALEISLGRAEKALGPALELCCDSLERMVSRG